MNWGMQWALLNSLKEIFQSDSVVNMSTASVISIPSCRAIRLLINSWIVQGPSPYLSLHSQCLSKKQHNTLGCPKLLKIKTQTISLPFYPVAFRREACRAPLEPILRPDPPTHLARALEVPAQDSAVPKSVVWLLAVSLRLKTRRPDWCWCSWTHDGMNTSPVMELWRGSALTGRWWTNHTGHPRLQCQLPRLESGQWGQPLSVVWQVWLQVSPAGGG